MQGLNIHDFSQIIGDKVRLTDGEGHSQDLILTSVTPSKVNNKGWQSHVVSFQGSSEFHFTQGNYQIAHKNFNIEHLFISPKSLIDYEAVITSSKKD